MLWTPRKGIIKIQHNFGNVGALPIGTAVVTGATSSTKTATPVQLIASTNFDAYWISVYAMSYSLAATNSKGCLDIMIGGAAAEEVRIPDLLMGACGGFSAVVGAWVKRWDFPLYIPAGTRLSTRAAGERTSSGLFVGVAIYGEGGYPPFRVGSRVVTYGTGTVPAGTTVTPGTSGAEGSWTEITSSTTEDHFAVIPSFQPGTGDTTLTTKYYFMDIGIGAATEEVLLGAEQSYIYKIDTTEACEGPYSTLPCFQDIPSGSRLVARLSNSGTADGSTPACSLHCVS